MGENFDLESNKNVSLIQFDDQQKAKIGAALQALADQIVSPKLDNQLLNSYGVDDGNDSDVGNPYVNTIKQEKTENETVIDSTLRIKDEYGIGTCISNSPNSNQTLLVTSNDLSTYINQTKEEPLLLKFEIEPTALEENSLSPCKDDLNFSKVVEPIKMEDIVDEDSELSKDCCDETFVGGENIDSIETDSQKSDSQETDSQDDDQNDEQESVVKYKSFVHYICPECGVDCGPYSKWKLHTETQHTISWLSFISETNLDGDSCFQCLKCKKKLSKKTSFKLLQEHHIKHLPHSSYLKCHFCDKRFQALSYVHHHVKQKHAKLIGPYLKNKHSNPNIRYIKIFCPICKESQSNIKLWQQHLTEKHDYDNKTKSDVTQIDKNLYSCNLCQKKTRRDYIKIHMLTHESNKSFQCILCKTYTTHLNAAVVHIKLKHLGNHQIYLHECSYCEATFAKKFLLLKHHKNVHKNEISKHTVVKRSLPKYEFETDVEHGVSNSLSQSSKEQCETTTHGTPTNKELYLQNCEFELLSGNTETTPACKDFSYSNEKYSPNISDEESEMSKYCYKEKAGESIDSMESDSQDDQSDKKKSFIECKSYVYICPECDLDCGSHSAWKLHTEKQHQIHWLNFNSITNKKGESYYQCPDCNKMLSQKMRLIRLQEHRMKHMPYSFYLKCRFCDKRFQTLSNVYPHMEQEHPKLSRPYLKKKYSSPILKYIKIFCPICQQSQTNVKHWWQHLTEKHDYANKAKSQATQLDKKMYSCNLCKQKIRQTYIKIHMLLHEPNKSFQCVLCKKYQSHERSVIKHINEKHLTNYK